MSCRLRGLLKCGLDYCSVYCKYYPRYNYLAIANKTKVSKEKIMDKIKKTVIAKKSSPKKPVTPKYYGYKVVRKVGTKLQSCSVGKMIVQYITDKFVGPRMFGGPLTLFSNKYEAIGFINKLEHKEDMRVYRAEYIPSALTYCFRGLIDGMDVRRDIPSGTVLAQKVKILKKIF